MPSPSGSCSHDRRAGGPSRRAAQLALEAAWHRGDDRVAVIGHPVRLVVIEERDGGRLIEGEGDVRPVAHRTRAVVLVPGAVEGGLVLPGARGHGEAALPDAVLGVERQARGGALRLPVAGTPELLLEAARDGDGDRLGAATPAGPATAVVAAARPSTTPSTTVLRHMCVTPVCGLTSRRKHPERLRRRVTAHRISVVIPTLTADVRVTSAA